jgi:hypothetical protein
MTTGVSNECPHPGVFIPFSTPPLQAKKSPARIQTDSEVSLRQAQVDMLVGVAMDQKGIPHFCAWSQDENVCRAKTK